MVKMARSELLDRLKQVIDSEAKDSDNDELLSSYLDSAEAAVLDRRYPFGVPDDAELTRTQQEVQLEIAAFFFNKRGMEFESLHSENGISRSYGGTTYIPETIMRRIVPIGMVY